MSSDGPRPLATTPGLGVYVHFPYCRAVCPYCNFNSHVVAEIPHTAYADAILAELRTRVLEHALPPTGVRSVYFGGGTPGLWHPAQIARVLAGVDDSLGLPADAEVTAEVNPGSVDIAALPELRAAGVNRLSIGVQSLHDKHLHRLGRLHTASDALGALRRALEVGFRSVSIDFMFALPGQPLAEWQGDLERVAGLGAQHLSLYSLTVEEGTPLFDWVRRGQVKLPDEESEALMFEAAADVLSARGYVHYEVSNFARPGHEAVHNALYWLGGEWLGLGAGAHGFLRTRAVSELGARDREAPSDAVGLRWADVDEPADYMRGALAGERPEAFHEWRTPLELVREEWMTGVRWLGGVDLDAFGARHGFDALTAYGEVLAGLARDGLAHVEAGPPRRLVLSAQGLLLLNRVAARFFEAEPVVAIPPG